MEKFHNHGLSLTPYEQSFRQSPGLAYICKMGLLENSAVNSQLTISGENVRYRPSEDIPA